MLLAATTAEIKKWAKVTNNFDPLNLVPSANEIKKYLIDVLGDDEFNLLVTNYDAATLTPEQSALLPYVQKAMVNLAMYDLADSGQLEISNAGWYIISSAERKPASGWLIKENQRALKKVGFNAVQDVLLFLWSSDVGSYTLWRASDNKDEHLKFFCNSTVDFQRGYNIKENYALLREMKDSIDFVEMEYIYKVIQTPVADDIKEKIKNFSLSDIEKKLLEKINKALANKVIVHALPKLISVFDELGVFENFSSQQLAVNASNPARDNAVSIRIREADKIGERYLADLAAFLKDNADEFSLYVPDTSEPTPINTIENGIYTII